MPESVDSLKAKKILHKAYQDESIIPTDKYTAAIQKIITGTHKTYKYILVNGLLAKATNDKVNPVALQASSGIIGAFDARSLCHEVLVKFEREYLANALGGSNEPFLNKPARFPTLSKDNAVRAGGDKETLLQLIEIFQSLSTSEKAYLYLIFVLRCLKERIEDLKKLNDSTIEHNPAQIEVFTFIESFISKSFEGETCVIATATVEKLFCEQYNDFSVVSHKVNQSGASSKETADIDVFKDGILLYGIEVKDKNFAPSDVEHAFNKIIQAKGSKGFFVFGPNARYSKEEVQKRLIEYNKQGFYTVFCSVSTYAKLVLSKLEIADTSTFVKTLIDISIEINCKETTKEWIQQLLISMGWKQ